MRFPGALHGMSFHGSQFTSAIPGYLLLAAVGLSIVLAACTTAGPAPTATPTSTTVGSPVPSAAPTPGSTPSIRDVMGLQRLGPLEPGTYFIDPDGDGATPLRVVYEIAARGWRQWIGAAKFSDVGSIGISITTVTNLVTHGCHDHSWATPAVGPSVADLGAALSTLAPFRVTSPATDVTIWGYSGKHLAWTVPDMQVSGPVDSRSFTGCDEHSLKSWVAFVDAGERGDAFYGYTGPGYREDFWILDVDGTRLMIAAEQSADSPKKDLAERQAILDSIRIEP